MPETSDTAHARGQPRTRHPPQLRPTHIALTLQPHKRYLSYDTYGLRYRSGLSFESQNSLFTEMHFCSGLPRALRWAWPWGVGDSQESGGGWAAGSTLLPISAAGEREGERKQPSDDDWVRRLGRRRGVQRARSMLAASPAVSLAAM